MASQSTGIQQLLAAENRAAVKVSEARKRKARRLKQAKEEAQAEVEAYRQERERLYREHESKILGSKGDMEKKIAISTKAKIEEIDHNITTHKEKALKQLLGIVCSIKPELHENYNPDLDLSR